MQEITGVTDLPNIGLGFGFARSGGGGGDGGDVEVISEGDIYTHGSSSIGILAQSVGGGGGLAGGTGLGPTISVFSGSVGGDGDAGEIDVSQTGIINTNGGYAAHGIFAQSAGGGDGANVGAGKDVDIMLDGMIIATGQNAMGILAQSIGGDGNGNITATIAEGSTLIGGTLTGLVTPDQPEVAAGIRFLDGGTNSVMNYGWITTIDGLTGLAIGATTGDDSVLNYGVVTGSIDLGIGTNSFLNEVEALFNMGLDADVGAGNFLTNLGTLSPGGEGTVYTTDVTGSLIQASDAGTIVDLDWDHSDLIDLINVTGTADLSGDINLNVYGFGGLAPGSEDLLILSADGTVTNPDLTLVHEVSAIATYAIVYPNANDVIIRYSVDFIQPDLNINQTALGDYINEIQTGGSFEGFEDLIEVIYGQETSEDLAALYDRLGAELYADRKLETIFSSMDFAEALLSCRSRDGAHRFIKEGECVWMRVSGGTGEHDANIETIGFENSSVAIAGGYQRQITDNWHIGMGGSHERSWLSLENGSKGEGEKWEGGGVLKGQFDETTFASSLTYGYANLDSNRLIIDGEDPVVARGTQKLRHFTLNVRGARTFEQEDWYVKPMVDVNASYLRMAEFEETGAGVANLHFDRRTETIYSIRPSFEIGAEFGKGSDTTFRPYIDLGLVHFLSDMDGEIGATFVGAPEDVPAFYDRVSIGETFGEVNAGIDIFTDRRIDLKVGYQGRFSDEYTDHSGSLKFVYKF